MKKFWGERKLNIICSAASLVLMWLAWIIAYYCVRNDYVIPSFWDSVVALWAVFKEAKFWTAFLFTFLRTLEAFFISFALAALFSVCSAAGRIFSSLIKPIMVILRTLPTLAVILMLLIWSTPRVAPVIVTVLVMFPMIYAQIEAAVGEIDGGLKEMLLVYGVSKKERIFKAYLPLVAPNVLSQTGANVSLALKIMISAEVLANTAQSLGGMMQTARFYLDMPRLAALTIASVVLGLVADAGFSQLKRVTYKWSRKEGE